MQKSFLEICTNIKISDIGSAKIKPAEQYALSGNKIEHHMIDIVEPDEEFSVADYKQR